MVNRAETAGFEPTRLSSDRFQDDSIKPGTSPILPECLESGHDLVIVSAQLYYSYANIGMSALSCPRKGKHS